MNPALVDVQEHNGRVTLTAVVDGKRMLLSLPRTATILEAIETVRLTAWNSAHPEAMKAS